jgi:hypothetical protein
MAALGTNEATLQVVDPCAGQELHSGAPVSVFRNSGHCGVWEMEVEAWLGTTERSIPARAEDAEWGGAGPGCRRWGPCPMWGRAREPGLSLGRVGTGGDELGLGV